MIKEKQIIMVYVCILLVLVMFGCVIEGRGIKKSNKKYFLSNISRMLISLKEFDCTKFLFNFYYESIKVYIRIFNF